MCVNMCVQLYTLHVLQVGGADKTPATITRRYSDFQRLHTTLRRNHGDQMHKVCFPRKRERERKKRQTVSGCYDFVSLVAMTLCLWLL